MSILCKNPLTGTESSLQNQLVCSSTGNVNWEVVPSGSILQECELVLMLVTWTLRVQNKKFKMVSHFSNSS